MHTTNYFDTFIAIADDCPAKTGEAPPTKELQSAVQIQYALLAGHPYEHTSDEVLYRSNGERRGQSREEFFSKGQPCFRSSPLTKRYGWGVHSNAEGRIAIYAVGSDEYCQLAADTSLKQLKGMRSTRAG
ncbi:MAG: hypothetical protein H0U76_13985 [Ktedonobacteraceae bacterium]|nr:hypothetical protein [Ktedonobacteraceae bacterium]